MGQFRFGVSARILVGIGLLAALTVVTGAVALTALHDFRDDFSNTAERRIPRMLTAARLREESGEVLADVAALTLADTQHRREEVAVAIEERISTMRSLTAALGETGADDHWIEQLRTAREQLSRKVLALDSALEVRLEIRARLRLRLAALRRLEMEAFRLGHELVALPDSGHLLPPSGTGEYATTFTPDEMSALDAASSSEYGGALRDWLEALHDAKMLLNAAVAAESVEQIDAQARRLRRTLDHLRHGLQMLPPELSVRLEPLMDDLKSVGLGSGSGLFELRRAEIAGDVVLDRLLAASRFQADQLANAVAYLMADINYRVRQDAARFEQEIDRFTVFLLLACLLSGLAATGVAVYVNGSVRKRLRRLQEALRAYPAEDGSPPADRRPDEIGDIGRALGYFMREIRRRERRLQELASTDGLTQASNRRHFLEQAAREFARARRGSGRLALLMLDMDHFKAINDRHGHATGDDVLRALAYTCKASLRAMDVFGRLGGEEFAILLPDTALDQAVEIAERLHRRLVASAVPAAGGQPLRFTVSIGVAALDAGDADIDALLSRADAGLYQAKRDGRNCVRFRTPPGDPNRALAS